MASNSWDVVVIGAGAAGLAATRSLAESGYKVLVLEARDRLGGRIWTRREAASAVPIELGSEFIHGDIPLTMRLLREVGQIAVHTGGSHWSVSDGEPQQRSDDLFGQIQAALARPDILEQPDRPLQQILDRGPMYGLSPQACALASAFVQGFDAADPELVSVHSIAREWNAGGMLDAPQFRPLGGYDAVLRALIGAIDDAQVLVQLQTVVTTVHWSRGHVEIDGVFLDRPFHVAAPRAIVTLPIGVLQQPLYGPDSVRFIPALDVKAAALSGLISGPALKVMLRFREPFWDTIDDARYQGAAFFHCTSTLFPTFWTPAPLRAPLLAAWMGGPKAAALSASTDSSIIDQATQSLRQVFGTRLPAQLHLEAAYVHNWQRDPFSRGAYSYVRSGHTAARARLAEPVEQTLYFAGEATDTDGEAATVTGALRSGLRAASQVIASRPKRVD